MEPTAMSLLRSLIPIVARLSINMPLLTELIADWTKRSKRQTIGHLK